MPKFNDRTGETRTMNSGLPAIIVAYRNSHDMDIAFPDGQIVSGKYYSDFANGLIKCPLTIKHIDSYAIVSNLNIESRPTWLMDIEDLHILNGWLWGCDSKGYVIRNSRSDGKHVLLHRLIMNVSGNQTIDHINRNPRDNRKANLRICDYSQNLCNRGAMTRNKTGYKGVILLKHSLKYKATITLYGNNVHVGTFDTPEQAAIAYNAAAIKYHGEFARLNDV